MTTRVTMADVAAKAGVHVTTVSLALRNHPSLPLRTRERLQRLALKMGYRPDPALSALIAYRHGRSLRKDTETLAYVTHWNTAWGWKQHPAHNAFFEGAGEKATALGFKLEHFWLGEPGLTHPRMSRILHSRGITGLILASHRKEGDSLKDFDWSQFSAVKIDYSPLEPPLHMVTNDQTAIIRLAVQRVLAAGYRRIGFVMPRWWDEFVNLAWSAGFLVEQQQLSPKERLPILFYGGAERWETLQPDDSGNLVPGDVLEKWLRIHKPEVVLSCARFVLSSLAALGLSVPRELAFVEIFLEQCDGVLAGVHQNCRRVGEVAVEILAGQLHRNVRGVPNIPTATFIEGTWVEGRSLPGRLAKENENA
jgi:LacI family transcriptional regulator